MTILQLKYIIAVDTYRNFALAAKKCFITQPTLSMQIQKLEEELDVTIFDRSRKPVLPTPIGEKIINQARVNVRGLNKITEIIQDQKNQISGELKIGIIPTLAPYLLPLFVTKFLDKYPGIHILIEELLTGQILEKISQDRLDFGILVTPTKDKRVIEIPLFYESFVAYISTNHPLSEQSILDLHDLNLDEMLLLSEGHCFRNQVVNICPKHKGSCQKNQLQFESGSLETLKRIVENRYGYTLIPELAALNLGKKQKNFIRTFYDPQPVREVSLVIHRSYLKQKLIALFKQELLANIPESLRKNSRKNLIEWT